MQYQIEGKLIEAKSLTVAKQIANRGRLVNTRTFDRVSLDYLALGHKQSCLCKACRQSRIKYLTPYGAQR